MEFLNKIELQGIVGQVSTSSITDKVKIFTVCVQEPIISEGGHILMNNTWFNCVVSDIIEGYDTIAPKQQIHLKGRMKFITYTTADGGQRSTYEVIVQELL